MRYWIQFKDFDPLNGRVPLGSLEKLQDIVLRARAILAGRTSEQITLAAEAIDWFRESQRRRTHPSYLNYPDTAKLSIIVFHRVARCPFRFDMVEVPGSSPGSPTK